MEIINKDHVSSISSVVDTTLLNIVESEYPIKAYLFIYALNLIAGYTFSNELLNYCLSLLTIISRKEFLSLILENGGLSEIESQLCALNNLDEPDRWSSLVFKDIVNGKVSIGVGSIRDYFKKHLIREQVLLGTCDNKKNNIKIENLKKIFDLSDEDVNILNFIYCIYSTNNKSFSNISDTVTFFEFLKLMSIAIGIPLSIVKKRINIESRLYQSGIIKYIDPVRSDYFSLDGSIEEYLSGLSDITLVDNYIQIDEEPVHDLASFCIDEMSIDIIKTILASPQPCNILFYGIAGTGKTEFARSLVSSLNKKIIFLKYGESEIRNRFSNSNIEVERIKALSFINKLLTTSDGILIVDEADFLLNTKKEGRASSVRIEKGWLNNFLDRSKAKIIWISNEVGSMEDSTLRRFSYSLYFHEFSAKERENIWNVILKDCELSNILDEDMVKSLSVDYNVNAGGIASALNTLSSFFKEKSDIMKSRENVEKVTREVLAKHEILMTGNYIKNDDILFNDLCKNYDLSVLNIDTDTNSFLTSIERFLSSLKTDPDNNIRCLNLLFWGLPGTGKTEFVKYIAHRTKYPLIIKRYSDIASPFVGEAEINIRNSFQEARQKKAILFIDEADSFFTNREQANRSWEVSRTNEFLTQMENHIGMLICCTNLLPNLDRAVMRRFSWKIEFKPLDDEAKLKIYNKYFSINEKALSKYHEGRIKEIPNLTAGDVKAVWQRQQYMLDVNNDHEYIINELLKEVGYKTKNESRIGY